MRYKEAGGIMVLRSTGANYHLPSEDLEVLVSVIPSGTRELPTRTIDLAETGFKEVAEDLVDEIPAINEARFGTNYFRGTDNGSIETTLYVFPVLATNTQEWDGFEWVDIDRGHIETTKTEYLAHKLKATINHEIDSLSDLGIPVPDS